MRIGVLTGGGDAPGLNAAIRAVARRCFDLGDQPIGIRNGWAGLTGNGDFHPLTAPEVSGILQLGGTILGTTRTNPLKSAEQSDQVLANVKRKRLDAVVVIGGDDTLSVACGLEERGLRFVGIPKTVDNDICETDYCIGFDSAVSVVAEALDRDLVAEAGHAGEVGGVAMLEEGEAADHVDLGVVTAEEVHGSFNLPLRPRHSSRATLDAVSCHSGEGST